MANFPLKFILVSLCLFHGFSFIITVSTLRAINFDRDDNFDFLGLFFRFETRIDQNLFLMVLFDILQENLVFQLQAEMVELPLLIIHS